MIYSAVHLSLEPYLLKILIDRILNHSQDLSKLIEEEFWIALSFPLLGFLNVLAWRAKDFSVREVVPAFKIKIIDSLFAYIHEHSHRFFQENFAGQIANKIKEVQIGIEEIFESSIDGFRTFCIILISGLFLWNIHPLLSVILMFWSTVFIGVGALLYARAIPTSEQFSELRSLTFGNIVDSISNYSAVKLFASRLFEQELLRKSLKKIQTIDRQYRLQMMLTWTILGLIFCLCSGFLIFSLLYLRSQNAISVGDFAFVLWSAVAVLDNTWMVTEKLSQIPKNVGICKNGLSLLTLAHEVGDPSNAIFLAVKKGSIEFQKVCFQHQQAKTPLFEDLSVRIESGSKVGLVGYSGSGKSSFIHLLIRLFDLNQGCILVDGQNISTVFQDSLRACIGFIPQEPTLFHRSLRENIRYGKPTATDQEVEEAAQQAFAHDFILQTPEGYDSLVGERGVKLSGGQRQRIAIARAILKNAPLLILDEATSALDSVTESLIQKSLNQLMNKKTSLVIAHRLSTLLEMDRILVFDQGKIVEDGNHEALLEQQGLYFKLWKSQIGGFLPDQKTG